MLRIRAVLTPALVLILLAVLVAATRSPAHRGRGSLRSRPVLDQPAYGLEGVGLAVANSAAWYQKAGADLAAAARAREAARVAALPKLVTTTPSVGSTTPARVGGVNWDGIASCETGSNWGHQTQYDGGLGILHAAWIEFGGRDFAEYGSQTSRENQIIVAERMYHRFGNLNGWGCKAYG